MVVLGSAEAVTATPRSAPRSMASPIPSSGRARASSRRSVGACRVVSGGCSDRRGIGLRGPGETQLETDRRLLNQRIDQIGRRLAKVDSQREQGRRARRRNEVPTASLVGYTNAGKSTLFNRITASGVYAADQLFATLDPTLRRLELPGAVLKACIHEGYVYALTVDIDPGLLVPSAEGPGPADVTVTARDAAGNTGTDTGLGVTLTDTLPPGVTFLSASGGGRMIMAISTSSGMSRIVG